MLKESDATDYISRHPISTKWLEKTNPQRQNVDPHLGAGSRHYLTMNREGLAGYGK
jgi:hypothetical protein